VRHEVLKPRSGNDYHSRDYLLTVRIGNISKKIVWNDRTTLCLDHPQGWTISKMDANICLFDGSDPDLQRRSKVMLVLTGLDKNKMNVDVPPSFNKARKGHMALTITPLVALQPPYKQVTYDGTASARLPRQLLMYQGVRYFLLKYRPVGKKLTASANNTQVFKYERTVAGGYSITAFTSDLKLKRQGRKQQLTIGVPYLMNEAEFFSSSFIHGINWWRFRSVVTPDALPPLEEDETEEDAREISRFNYASRGVVVSLVLLLCASFAYNFFNPPKPPVIVTKVELRAPKVIPHAEIAEVKPPPPPPPEPPKEKEKPKEVVQEKPKPKPALEKKIVKKEIVKPKKIAKKEPAKAPPKKVAKAEPKVVKKVEKPQVEKPQKVAKVEPVAAPAPPAPVKKAIDVPAKPGVVAKKTEAPPAPDESAQLLKSLSFLSSGAKNPKQGGLAKYDKSHKKDFMNSPTLGGSTKDSATLDKISSASTDTSIKTRSARSIASDAGFDAPQGKGLNDVQGKVSLTQLYASGSGAGEGFEDGATLSLSGPGDLSEAAIEKALAKYIARFQFCYEKSLLTDSSLAGNIRLQWTIGTSGGVSASKVINSQMKNAALHSCILGVLKEIPFPHPKGGPVTAKKTFSFKSSAL